MLFSFACTEGARYFTGNDQASELKKVLQHYEEIDDDKQKQEAAAYLTENIQYHQAKYSHKSFKETFEKIGNSKTDKERNRHQDEFESFDHQNVELKNDQQVITAEFLINNIDLAFKAWRTYPWCKNISFEEFKLYILPYRISNEPIEDCRAQFQKKYAWVLDSMKNSSEMEKAFTLIYNDFYSEYSSTGTSKYPIPMNYSQFMAAKRGLCQDACNALGMALRSMGIKCTFDYSVIWGNQNPVAHSWISYPKNDSLTYYIDKDKILKIPQHIHSAKFSIDEPGAAYLTDDITPQYYKRGTKVRRLLFHRNLNTPTFNDSEEILFGNWNDLCSVDITNRYIKTANINLSVERQSLKDQILYLTVFNERIVDLADIRNGNASFSNLGMGNMYFPRVNRASQLMSVLNPFQLKQDGGLRFFIPDTGRRQNITVNRKYPLLAYTLNNANFLFHGRFQGSNWADFRDAVDLFKIRKTYLFPTEVRIKDSRVFRYVRFLPEESRKLSIAEVAFYSLNKGKEERISGKFLTNSNESLKEMERAFDNDFTTIFHKDKGSWIGLDFGEGHEKRLSKIKFCPRTDSNFIIPGNDYELFYWDNDWVTLGRKKATDYKLAFNDVPNGAIFWLHCLNGGLEERPFTYESGRQIWW